VTAAAVGAAPALVGAGVDTADAPLAVVGAAVAAGAAGGIGLLQPITNEAAASNASSEPPAPRLPAGFISRLRWVLSALASTALSTLDPSG
jgi:hypothetical protein